MNEVKNLLKALKERNKTELKSEKVELASAQDLKSLLPKLKGLQGQFNKSVQKMVNSLQDFAKAQADLDNSFSSSSMDAQDAEQDIKEAEKLVTELATKAKELGLDPRKVFPEASEVVNIVADLEDTLAIFNRNEADAKRILAI